MTSERAEIEHRQALTEFLIELRAMDTPSLAHRCAGHGAVSSPRVQAIIEALTERLHAEYKRAEQMMHERAQLTEVVRSWTAPQETPPRRSVWLEEHAGHVVYVHDAADGKRLARVEGASDAAVHANVRKMIERTRWEVVAAPGDPDADPGVSWPRPYAFPLVSWSAVVGVARQRRQDGAGDANGDDRP
jgi:hypothetical protein